MAVNFRADQLTSAEASFVAWSFGFHEDDDPFHVALWHTISRAWISDTRSASGHLKRLAAPGAFPEEVGIFLRFKSDDGEAFWLDMLKRAGLTDRRQRSTAPAVERRKRPAAAG